MKQFLCPICKYPIVCTYERADLYFYQDKNDNIVRDTNENIISDYHFHCSNDKEDDIKDLDNLDEFIKWKHDYKVSILKLLIKEGLV